MRSPLLRAAFAALCVLTASYWLVVASAGSPSGGCGLRAPLGVDGCRVRALCSRCPCSRAKCPCLRNGCRELRALRFGVRRAAALWLWTRGDSDRFFWVIHQGYPCSAMGGGPGAFGSSEAHGSPRSPLS